MSSAQCNCTSSCITSLQSGNWNDCNTWNGVSCIGWSTATIMSNRSQVINGFHTITVPSGISSNHADSRGIYVLSNGTLNIGASLDGGFSASKIDVCGTLNVTGGNSEFNSATLTVYNGGVVNISGGVLEVDKIVVESGGQINISGNGELSRDNSFSGLEIKQGGTINILSSSAELGYHGFSSSVNSTIDGTLDLHLSMSSFNRFNVRLGNTRVSNGQSTGLIRTQTPYIASVEFNVTFSNNFFGSNSDYGGTVEYYGGSSKFLSTSSRMTYYEMEVNCPAVYLHTTTTVKGALRLTSGNLNTNNKQLIVQGTIVYAGSNYIIGGTQSEIELIGAIGSGLVNPIGSQGNSIDVTHPELRMSSFQGGSANLNKLRIWRQDVVHLKSDLEVLSQLNLQRGKLRTYPGSEVTVSSSDSAAVWHNSTAFSTQHGYVSGTLIRHVRSGVQYDFPVGYANSTDYTPPNHRRLSLDLRSANGLSTVEVHFETPTDQCSGQIALNESGISYDGIHPEGKWVVQTTGGVPSDIDVLLYTHGFDNPVLNDNAYAAVARSTASNLCADWSTRNGSLEPTDSIGRVIVLSGQQDISYAQRNQPNALAGDWAIGTGLLAAPEADFSTADTIVCAHDCIAFTDRSTGADNWLWQFEGGSPAQSTDQSPQSICYEQAGSFDVRLIVNGGSGSDTLLMNDLIQVNDQPASEIPADTGLCAGGALLLGDQNSSAEHLWQNGDTTATIELSRPGMYWLRLTNAENCSRQDTVHIDSIPFVAPNLTSDTICPGDTVLLNAGAGFITYSWNTGEQSSSIQLSETGFYSVVVTDSNGCVGTDTVEIVPPTAAGLPGIWKWTGEIDSNWFNYCNWDKHSVPDSLSVVLVPSGNAIQPRIVGDTAYCKTVEVEALNGAHLYIHRDAGGHLIKRP